MNNGSTFSHLKVLKDIAKRLSYYLLIAILIFLISKLPEFSSNTTDADSARYMVSTFIQSQATVFVLVVTISLIIVQQTASFYSIRLVKDSLTNLDFIIVSLIYIFTILYEAWVLRACLKIQPDLTIGIGLHI
jgi:hypothetical protein